MNACDVQSFGIRAAKERECIFGGTKGPPTITYHGATIEALVIPVSESRELEAGGPQSISIASVRILRWRLATPPILGEDLLDNRTGILYRVGSIEDRAANPSWIINLVDSSAP